MDEGVVTLLAVVLTVTYGEYCIIKSIKLCQPTERRGDKEDTDERRETWKMNQKKKIVEWQ